MRTGPNFFLQHLKNKIIFNFVKFVATKIGLTTNFFSPLSFVAVFGSGIRDQEWVKIRIRDEHPGSATLIIREKKLHGSNCSVLPITFAFFDENGIKLN